MPDFKKKQTHLLSANLFDFFQTTFEENGSHFRSEHDSFCKALFMKGGR